ncbi:hypothetical protein FN846DRAFT_998808 [Sphaerosporella brunnea]|uniref:Uncharacterized protein n=1 Tax=Sphaerosporella brunnea TaxID=1250544 RepID=A0A5J5EIS2_9PEZI|nr:hypothetical protein FN846DRAFT_998808 [Sphaerosporella brunnea]
MVRLGLGSESNYLPSHYKIPPIHSPSPSPPSSLSLPTVVTTDSRYYQSDRCDMLVSWDHMDFDAALSSESISTPALHKMPLNHDPWDDALSLDFDVSSESISTPPTELEPEVGDAPAEALSLPSGTLGASPASATAPSLPQTSPGDTDPPEDLGGSDGVWGPGGSDGLWSPGDLGGSDDLRGAPENGRKRSLPGCVQTAGTGLIKTRNSGLSAHKSPNGPSISRT